MTAVSANPVTAAAMTVVLMRLLVNIALRPATADTPVPLLLLYRRLLVQAVVVNSAALAAAGSCDCGCWRFWRLARSLLWWSY